MSTSPFADIISCAVYRTRHPGAHPEALNGARLGFGGGLSPDSTPLSLGAFVRLYTFSIQRFAGF